jgi:Holliday junction resolvase-like predicted endonuclease
LLKNINIIKASGESEPFSENKLRRSLERANAPSALITKIVEHIMGELEEGMKTSDIYNHAYSLLNKKEHFIASRYSIKKALLELGPSGYPFEKIVSELLRVDGYIVQTNQIIQGYCISHEVDVVAKKDDHRVFVECKFHHRAGYKTDVKAALYVNARFWDIKKHLLVKTGQEKNNLDVWLVTNTKLSSEAIRYCKCSGIKAIGWDYPYDDRNLQYLLEESGLLPITCLTSLNRIQKNDLMRLGFVICQEIAEQKEILHSIGLSDNKIVKVLKEVQELCRYKVKSAIP